MSQPSPRLAQQTALNELRYVQCRDPDTPNRGAPEVVLAWSRYANTLRARKATSLNHPGSGTGSLARLRRLLGSETGQIVALLVLALLPRLVLQASLPIFAAKDSQSYLAPAYEFTEGEEFSLDIRRTPLYPLLLIGALKTFGYDLQYLALLQHLLGVGTTGLTYLLGRLTFGRAAGLGAGLLVAFGGPRLAYERFVMSETLFTTVLLLALVLGSLALRRPTVWSIAGTGLALGLAILTRPVAQILIPLLPLAFLFAGRSWRQSLRGTSWYLVGLLVVLLPWMASSALVDGSASTTGALGQALVGRTIRNDDYTRYYDCANPTATIEDRVRRTICNEAVRKNPSGGAVTRRVGRDLGLDQAQTSRLLRDVALEAIMSHPVHYLQSTLKLSLDLFRTDGTKDRLATYLRQRTDPTVMRVFAPHELSAFFPSIDAASRAVHPLADLVTAYRPARWWPLLGAGILLAIGFAIIRREYRPALLVSAAAGLLLLGQTALGGANHRYLYPIEPLFAVLATGGWLAAGGLVGRRILLTGGRQHRHRHRHRSKLQT